MERAVVREPQNTRRLVPLATDSADTLASGSMETDYRELEGGGRRGSTKSSSALKGALAAAIVVIIGLAVATGYFASHGGAGGDPHVIDGSSSGSGPSSSSSPDMPEDVEADIRRMMDPSKDPCTDPYGYMCGNFMASTHPTDDNPSIIYGFSNITMQTYQEQFGILRSNFPFISPFYETCRNTDAINAAGFQPLFNGYVRRVDATDLTSAESVMELVGELKTSGVAGSAFFSHSLQADLREGSPTRLYIVPGGLTAEGVPYDDPQLKQAIVGMMKAIFQAVGGQYASDANATAAAESTYGVEQYISAHAYATIEATSTVDYFNWAIGNTTLGTIEEQAAATKLKLQNFIEGLQAFFDPAVDEPINIDGLALIQREALAGLTSLFNPNVISVSDLRTYIVWHVIWSTLPYLPSPLPETAVQIQQQFGLSPGDWGIVDPSLLDAISSGRTKNVQRILSNTGALRSPTMSKQQWIESLTLVTQAARGVRLPVRRPPGAELLSGQGAEDFQRDFMCYQTVVSHFAQLFGHEWVAEDFPRENKAAGTALVDAIQLAMNDTITESAWLDEATRAAALDKLWKIAKNVAYPATWVGHVGLRFSGDVLADRAAASRWANTRALSQAGQAVDRTGFSRNMDFMTQNAFYQPTTNSINMLAGLMLKPMFSADWPLMLNIASYGYVIGHEITHGFDNSGRHFDGVGGFKDWWEPATGDKFDSKAQCLVDQYSSFTYFGVPVDGALTLGENIADEGGVDNAHRAFLKNKPAEQLMAGFTNEQLFFIKLSQVWCTHQTQDVGTASLQDVHSPGKFRIIGPMSNFKPYAEAFSCADTALPGGRSLTPDACKVW